ncbi:sulfite exporter TauE/SafE family protein [Candidatus Woesearchaeota archaeon]|nr:sulfite exporter TauE/SafE family protein [Candidatus Woesearchaeota archaeon]MBL7051269.1 sulfite exporter TauE/SafE family protein [Candidatus Woesearchaeota archaeon]
MILKKGFIAEGTTCESCVKIIKNQALKVKGVKDVEFDYSTEIGYVSFDDEKTNLDEILYKIEEKNYTCYLLDEKKSKSESKKLWGWIFGIVGVLIVAYFLFGFVEGIEMPKISQNMGYGLLFLVGLLTGFHCVAMCGGFIISYTAKDAQEGRNNHKSHLMYGIGKTLSYTLIGAIFGLIGSIIAFTPTIRGVAGLLAGGFLILFGLKMLNVFPILRKIQFRTPKFLAKIIGKKSSESSSPLVIGLLNGLFIACGPLQAMYVMAAGTGSMIEGAKILFFFGIGTLPVLLGFGYFASLVSSKMTHKILKLSGALVILLGLVMVNNGLVLTGTGYDFGSIVDSIGSKNIGGDNTYVTGSAIAELGNVAVLKDGYQEIRMDVVRSGWSPDKFVLQKDVPVKWIVNGKEITGCNSAIQVPKYGLEFNVIEGEQTIEFTPTEEGTIKWSCWMGMIPGTFIVVDDLGGSDVEKELNNLESSVGSKSGSGSTCGASGSCDGSCGGGSGCGCGGR